MPNPKIFWFAIAFSTVIYAVIAYVMAPVPPRPFAESVRATLTLAMYAAAFATFIAAMAIPSRLPRSQPLQKMIVALALFEACALLGLVAAFMLKDWRLYVPAWIAAVIGFVREYPSGDVSAV